MQVTSKSKTSFIEQEKLKYITDSIALWGGSFPSISTGFFESKISWLKESVYRKSLDFISQYLISHLALLAIVLISIDLPGKLARAAQSSFNLEVISLRIKRAVDISGASVGLVLCIPVFIILPVIIKLDSSGPVFFKQLRIGLNRRRGDRRNISALPGINKRSGDRRQENAPGKSFEILKFRTMRQDAEKSSGPVWASKDDPRITRLGKFLRTSRLDEIPQLINVLKGEMSLVGPRPERPYFIEKLSKEIDYYNERLRVKPGITGLAQVEHGYDQTIDDVRKKISFDIAYIKRWNIIRDFGIMLKTVIVMITGKGI